MDPCAVFLLGSGAFAILSPAVSIIATKARERREAENNARRCSAGCGEWGARWFDCPPLCGACRRLVIAEIADAIDPYTALEVSR